MLDFVQSAFWHLENGLKTQGKSLLPFYFGFRHCQQFSSASFQGLPLAWARTFIKKYDIFSWKFLCVLWKKLSVDFWIPNKSCTFAPLFSRSSGYSTVTKGSWTWSIQALREFPPSNKSSVSQKRSFGCRAFEPTSCFATPRSPKLTYYCRTSTEEL